MMLPDLTTLQDLCSTHRIGLTWPYQVEVAGEIWTVATDGHGMLAVRRRLEGSVPNPPPPAEVLSVTRSYIERASAIGLTPVDLTELRAWCRTRFQRSCLRCEGTGTVSYDGEACDCDRGEGLWRTSGAGRLGNRRVSRQLAARWLAWIPDGAPLGAAPYGPNPLDPVLFGGERWLMLLMPLDEAIGGGDEPVFAIGPAVEAG